MNEFIVWDKRINSINSDLMIDKDGHAFGLSGLDNDVIYLNREDYSVHRAIKTDINNNKIYADCSIVEFVYIGYRLRKHKLKGYFRYNDSELSYEVVVLSRGWATKSVNYESRFFYDLKIIDTIQENKLGLIKEVKEDE